MLFGAFMDEFSQFSGKPFRVVDIAVPEVLVGGLIGQSLVGAHPLAQSRARALASGRLAQTDGMLMAICSMHIHGQGQ